MRRSYLVFALLYFTGFAIAQTSCHSVSVAHKATAPTCIKSAAAQVAAKDPNIERRTDPQTGQVSYVRKSVCPISQRVSYQKVSYCQKSGAFVNAAPSATAGQRDDKSCEKDCSKPCNAGVQTRQASLSGSQ